MPPREVVRTLLVEDNPGDARLLQVLLSEVTALRAQLTHVVKLSDALALLRTQTFDVLLLDLSLPDAHGIETVTRANAAAPLIPIVVLTGLDDEAVAVRAMHAGAQDYLVKGQVESPLLGRAIRYAMERKRAEENARTLLKEQAARARAEERRSRFLAEVSRTLATTLDYEATLASVTQLAVPTLADCCLLDLAQDNGELRRATLAFREDVEHGSVLPSGPREQARATSEDEPATRAFRSGEPLLLDVVDAAVYHALRVPPHVPMPRAVIALPLVARGRTLGAMTFLSTERPYGPEDVALAGELAGRAALAIDNARLYRAREEVLWVVSHDLRTPLSVVRGNAELLRGGYSREAVAAVERAADHMERLIKDLLDATRLDAGTLVVEPKRLGVAVLLEEASDMLETLAGPKNLKLVIEEADALPFIRADRDRVLQVFWNLVGNAIKFTPKGGTITIRAELHDREVRFSVSDTGPGIPERDLSRIFDRFWMGSRSDRRGAGLGLSIAKGIVEAHRGRIWVSSTEGRGTTFFFTVPVDSPDQAAQPPAAPRSPTAG